MDNMNMNFRRENVQIDYTELVKEALKQLNRTEDKKSMLKLLESIFQGEIIMMNNYQSFIAPIIDSMFIHYSERIAAYEKRYRMKRSLSLRPEKIEQRIADLALEDTRKMIADVAMISSPIIQRFMENRFKSFAELCSAFVELVQQNPATLEDFKFLSNQRELGEENGLG